MNRKERFSKISDLGCVACYLDGNQGAPCEIHHKRAGQGKKRASDEDTIGLCAPHHRGTMHPHIPSIHMDKMAFICKYGTEDELIELTNRLI